MPDNYTVRIEYDEPGLEGPTYGGRDYQEFNLSLWKDEIFAFLLDAVDDGINPTLTIIKS